MKKVIQLATTMVALLLITTFVVLYSDGWRFNLIGNNNNNGEGSVVIQTGMLAVRSVPEAAKVYIDGEAVTATDDTITSLDPGKYYLKVQKEGFETWEKEVEVFPELVTDITAVLVLQSPRLEPLTNTDVKAYSLSSNHNKIAFLTKNHENPGVWILPLVGNPLSVFRNNTSLLIEDNRYGTPSLGEALWWSPNDKELLVQMNDTGYLLYKLSDQNKTDLIPTSITNVEMVFERWQREWEIDFLQSKIQTITRQDDVPEWLINDLAEYNTVWSPDEEKLFYVKPSASNPGMYDLVVYNQETPLPVGETRLNFPIEMTKDEKNLTSFYWFSDSYHVILVKRDPTIENYYTISLVRIDGTNETVVYNGLLASDQAYITPAGDKIIVLTSLKENSANNLYGIAIR